MKNKIKFLLPISTLAIAGTAVIPSLTSCSKDEWIDLGSYAPTIEQHAAQPLSQQQATKELFNANNSIDIVKQDICYYLSESAEVAIALLLDYLGITTDTKTEQKLCSFSDLEINYVDADENSYAKLTGTIKLKFVCSILNDQEVKIGTYTLETKHVIKNLRYFVRYIPATSPDHWGVQMPLQNTLKNDRTWSVERTYNGVATYLSGVPDERDFDSYLYSYHNVDLWYEETTNPLWLLYWSSSYYLKKCSKQP